MKYIRNKGYAPIDKATKETFLEVLENLTFWDGKHELAIHAARLLLGKGIQFSSDTEEIENFINEVFDYNNITQFLFTATYWMSKEGRVIATVSKQGDKYWLEIAKPEWYNQMAKVRITPKLAILYKNTEISSNKYVIREKWDDEKVVREIYTADNARISLQGLNTELKEDERIPEVTYHNLGFVPIFEMLNNPILGTTLNQKATGDNAYKVLADTYPVENLELLINHLYKTVSEETVLNQSKVIGYYDNQNISKLSEQGSRLKYLAKRLFFNVKTPSGTGNEPSFEKLQPVGGYIEELTNVIKKFKGQYYDGAGYSTQDDAQMDTATQTLYAKSKDVATTKMKRDQLTEVMLHLIDTILILAGKLKEEERDKKRPYSFEIRENLNISETETINNEILKLDNGLATHAEALANIRGISEQEAESISKKIKEEQEAEQQKQIDQMGAYEQGLRTDQNGEPTTTSTNEVKKAAANETSNN